MKYDFDKVIDRRNAGTQKWDVAPGELPMSMADMDFEVAPAIRKAFEERIAHPNYGYTDILPEWYEAYMTWWDKRHHWKIEKDWLIFSMGVIPTLSTSVRKLTYPAENVCFFTPSYNLFFNSSINNGRFVKECPLHYENGEYSIDFDRFEECLSDPQVSLMVLCNPHNPVGKIWSREELQRIAHLCKEHNVTVLSDEIHCDLTDPGCEYIPFASVSEEAAEISVVMLAPTKAFSLAGIQTSAIAIPNKFLRHKVWRAINTDELAEPNILAAVAPAAAFLHSGDWLDEARQYIYDTQQYARAFIKDQTPDVWVVPSPATYLLWFDCRKITEDSEALQAFIRKETGLVLIDGTGYGDGGKGFLRMNLAYPRSQVEDGLARFEKGIKAFLTQK